MGAEWSAFSLSADFNADGKADILWTTAAGSVAIWQMNGPTLAGVGGGPSGRMGAEWHVEGRWGSATNRERRRYLDDKERRRIPENRPERSHGNRQVFRWRGRCLHCRLGI
ncbi:FG-GAP repeat domain-containing protein [Tardiphaga sp. 11_C7_N12_6]|uniref:FG-GAP repeat domain-containing protein n=1 Tax=Tardiphaga sp. 11_C7_N12_6 TaxID=3240789 RepID=UPI003F218665